MAEENGFDLVLGVVAVALAIWAQLLDSSVERASEFDSLRRFLAIFSVVIGYAILLAVIIAAGVITFLAGELSAVLSVVLLATVLISLPHLAFIGTEVLEALSELDTISEMSVALLAVFVVALALFLLLLIQ